MTAQPMPELYAPATCVIRHALDIHARERGSSLFAVFEDEAQWTYAQTLELVRGAAAGLASLGVARGDAVLVMLPNSGFALQVMLAINYLGAICVPINTAYRGPLLEHVLADSGATLAIVHDELLERVLEGARGRIRQIIGSSARAGTGVPGLTLHPSTSLTDPSLASAALPHADIRPWDTQFIMYTSGTTGPSKGVLSSYVHSYTSVGPPSWTCVREDDRQLVHLPLFHIGGAFVSSAALCRGSAIALGKGFRTTAFWDLVRATRATSVFLLGVMATFLLKEPPRPDDREHPLRMVFIVPLGSSGPAFAERFGVEVYTLFNMTEISTPLLSQPNPAKAGICGRPRPGVQVRLVDTHDCEVPAGSVGEMVVRTDQPWTMNHGYHNQPEATARAWRNGWFHTGDSFIVDADGDYHFKDRLKDAIRRRGENISSYEIEVVLHAHPGVREAAAIPVPAEHGEDEVMIVIAPVDGADLAAGDIFAYLQMRLAHFMLPRYLRIVDELPKTATAKVQKHVLREQGLTSDTLDLQQAGFSARRQLL
jgi:crotonobetaine/carnitine-CoA ligase